MVCFYHFFIYFLEYSFLFGTFLFIVCVFLDGSMDPEKAVQPYVAMETFSTVVGAG
jgi:hypothetical protein